MGKNKSGSLGEKMESAKKAEVSGDFFLAAMHCQDALALARDAGDSVSVKACKKKLIEVNKLAEDTFQKFSFEEEVPKEMVEKVIQSVVRKDLTESLRVIGIHPALYSKAQEIRAIPKPVMFAITNHFTVSEDGHVVRGGSDAAKAWFNMIYTISQGFISGVYLNRIFDRLEETMLNEKELLNYLKSSRLFPEENFKIIEVGISRYFSKDYISSLHILVLQFESVFLFLSEKLGVDVIALNPGKDISTQMKLLSADKLDTAEFQKVWSEDLCIQIKFVLFEQLGYNLRHKIAHGLIKSDECTAEMVRLVIYFYLVITARVEAEVSIANPKK